MPQNCVSFYASPFLAVNTHQEKKKGNRLYNNSEGNVIFVVSEVELILIIPPEHGENTETV